jgi:hypothetical protein
VNKARKPFIEIIVAGAKTRLAADVALFNGGKIMLKVKTNKPVGYRIADIGANGREYNVETDSTWDAEISQIIATDNFDGGYTVRYVNASGFDFWSESFNSMADIRSAYADAIDRGIFVDAT